MYRVLLITIITIIILRLVMFSSSNVEIYKEEKPIFELKEFFNGNIKAWGIIQDWKGKVSTSFKVDMVGNWEGDIGKLEEKFVYEDGREDNRTWIIEKKGDNSYIGGAHDIIGKANGNQAGNAINWKYKMDIEVSGKKYRVNFDDWMWLLEDNIVVNRSYIKKFGITVAELTLFMQKEKG